MTQDTSFLPSGYDIPSSGGKYMKFKQGENTFRVLSSPIVGWIDWKDNSPIRTKGDKPQPVDPERAVKHFWAMPVYNYEDNAIQILEITQSTIQGFLKALVDDADWGAPYEYDVKVTKTGEQLETKYAVTPRPKSPLSEEIKKLYETTPVNLEALYDGGDPFLDPNPTSPANVKNALAEAFNEQNNVPIEDIKF